MASEYKIQSVLFDKTVFHPQQAMMWLHQNGYKVKKVDETARMFRFRQVAPATLRRNGYTHFVTKKLGDSGIELVIAYPHALGGFLIPSLNPLQGYYDAAKFAYNFATGNRTYSKTIQDFFKRHGEERIVGLEVQREPVSSSISTLLSWLSGGKFKQNVKNADYDKLFHLSLNVTTENGTFFKIEKNEQITLSTDRRNQAGAEFVQVPVPNGARVFGFIDAGRKAVGDDNFFVYSAKDRNCQRFVLDILRANGCLTPEAQAFIFQDTSKIFEDLDYLRRISNTTTDLAYLARGLLGLGRPKIIRGGARRNGTKDIGVF